MVDTIEAERMQSLFTIIQKKMQSELEGVKTVLEHPTALGDAS